MLRSDGLSCAENALGFASEKTGGANFVFERSRFRSGECSGVPVFLEQKRSDHVHALIGALRAQNRRNQKLQWIFKIELTMCIGIYFAECFCQRESPYPCSHRLSAAAREPGLRRTRETKIWPRRQTRRAQANSLA